MSTQLVLAENNCKLEQNLKRSNEKIKSLEQSIQNLLEIIDLSDRQNKSIEKSIQNLINVDQEQNISFVMHLLQQCYSKKFESNRVSLEQTHKILEGFNDQIKLHKNVINKYQEEQKKHDYNTKTNFDKIDKAREKYTKQAREFEENTLIYNALKENLECPADKRSKQLQKVQQLNKDKIESEQQYKMAVQIHSNNIKAFNDDLLKFNEQIEQQDKELIFQFYNLSLKLIGMETSQLANICKEIQQITNGLKEFTYKIPSSNDSLINIQNFQRNYFQPMVYKKYHTFITSITEDILNEGSKQHKLSTGESDQNTQAKHKLTKEAKNTIQEYCGLLLDYYDYSILKNTPKNTTSPVVISTTTSQSNNSSVNSSPVKTVKEEKEQTEQKNALQQQQQQQQKSNTTETTQQSQISPEKVPQSQQQQQPVPQQQKQQQPPVQQQQPLVQNKAQPQQQQQKARINPWSLAKSNQDKNQQQPQQQQKKDAVVGESSQSNQKIQDQFTQSCFVPKSKNLDQQDQTQEQNSPNRKSLDLNTEKNQIQKNDVLPQVKSECEIQKTNSQEILTNAQQQQQQDSQNNISENQQQQQEQNSSQQQLSPRKQQDVENNLIQEEKIELPNNDKQQPEKQEKEQSPKSPPSSQDNKNLLENKQNSPQNENFENKQEQTQIEQEKVAVENTEQQKSKQEQQSEEQQNINKNESKTEDNQIQDHKNSGEQQEEAKVDQNQQNSPKTADISEIKKEENENNQQKEQQQAQQPQLQNDEVKEVKEQEKEITTNIISETNQQQKDLQRTTDKVISLLLGNNKQSQSQQKNAEKIEKVKQQIIQLFPEQSDQDNIFQIIDYIIVKFGNPNNQDLMTDQEVNNLTQIIQKCLFRKIALIVISCFRAFGKKELSPQGFTQFIHIFQILQDEIQKKRNVKGLKKLMLASFTLYKIVEDDKKEYIQEGTKNNKNWHFSDVWESLIYDAIQSDLKKIKQSQQSLQQQQNQEQNQNEKLLQYKNMVHSNLLSIGLNMIKFKIDKQEIKNILTKYGDHYGLFNLQIRELSSFMDHDQNDPNAVFKPTGPSTMSVLNSLYHTNNPGMKKSIPEVPQNTSGLQKKIFTFGGSKVVSNSNQQAQAQGANTQSQIQNQQSSSQALTQSQISKPQQQQQQQQQQKTTVSQQQQTQSSIKTEQKKENEQL